MHAGVKHQQQRGLGCAPPNLQSLSTPPCLPALPAPPLQVGNTLTACGEVGLQVAPGRPSLRDTLLSARKQASPGSTLGVFVGGEPPAALGRGAHVHG